MPRTNGPDSPVVAVPFGPITADQVIINTDGILMGWSVIETTGTNTAEIDLIDGSAASGALIVPIALLAGQSRSDSAPRWGIAITVQLTLHIVSGSVRGAVWVALP